MIFISFIIGLFVFAGVWELYLSASRQRAQSKHLGSSPKRAYVQLFFKLLHIS
ncbi:hypothetical protein IWT5_00923 [Secundilactobacillus silagincola]|uniref:Uncharacterized protein n=1 Tax=Secundilactobacillus silagincola TaxID=1714681 RepID=A0A1Z5J157_9LACO|nr:hypothetical protein IWT5_00923 [Secundilactobacillus silagincola]